MNSSETAIKVDGISKIYRIGFKEEMQSDSAAAAIFRFLRKPFKNYRDYRSLYNFDDIASTSEDRSGADSSDILWALKDISFNVKKGEVLGIIGGNGAGKSTLLKVLCKITSPTRGRAEIHGKMSSLLEVGTGFHPDLTGRENIYLNATILGMKKNDVDRKFDEIVSFSGVEKFIDTPVKRYSSGMAVRLAFSVAAHLEPEIMIIDEVLAVGDAEFQKKCMGRMESDARQGKTILLVSHNMSSITNLCSRAIYLEKGEVVMDGPSADVVRHYLSSNTEYAGSWSNSLSLDDDSDVYIESAEVLTHENKPSAIVEFDKPFYINVSYAVRRNIQNLCILFRLTDSRGNVLWTSWDTDNNDDHRDMRPVGAYASKCTLPAGIIRPGSYYISIGSMIPNGKLFAYHENILTFEMSEVCYPLNTTRVGIITPLLDWEVTKK